MTVAKMHLLRDVTADGEAVVAACGYAGTKCPSGGFRRFGGFRLRVTRDIERVTCGTCRGKADLVYAAQQETV